MPPMLTLLTGILAGAIHVASGPDHLAALAPIALRSRTAALRAGASWGVGHGIGVVSIGLVAMSFRGLVASWMSAGSERLVGYLLLGVGAWALLAAKRGAVDAVRHEGHVHVAVGVGILHGAAGTGHLLAVVPALALPPALAGVYLTGFLAGAVLAMSMFAAGIGALARRWGPGGVRAVMAASGVVAIGVGAVWIATAVGP